MELSDGVSSPILFENTLSIKVLDFFVTRKGEKISESYKISKEFRNSPQSSFDSYLTVSFLKTLINIVSLISFSYVVTVLCIIYH